jgi:hypothetical protein
LNNRKFSFIEPQFGNRLMPENLTITLEGLILRAD